MARRRAGQVVWWRGDRARPPTGATCGRLRWVSTVGVDVGVGVGVGVGVRGGVELEAALVLGWCAGTGFVVVVVVVVVAVAVVVVVFNPPVDGEIHSLNSPHVHVFLHVCVN